VADAVARLKGISDQLQAQPPDPPAVVVKARDNTAVTLRMEALDREAKRLAVEQKRITDEINGYRAKVDAVPIREQEMAELNRNYGVSKDHYQSLLDKAFQAHMASDLEQKQEAEHFTVLDVATVPEKPFKPQRRLLFPVAVLAALIVAVGLAYLSDQIRNSPRIERELRSVLPADIPVLTSIPKLKGASDRYRSIGFAVAAVMLFLLGCALNVAVFLRFHPKV
jgi:uncharacterized protein involved in exopolysaccharide biosynthesis